MFLRFLAVLPFIGILLGVPFANRVEPLVLGMPFVLAWIVLWVSSPRSSWAIIYRCDPANRQTRRSPAHDAALIIIVAVTVLGVLYLGLLARRGQDMRSRTMDGRRPRLRHRSWCSC